MKAYVCNNINLYDVFKHISRNVLTYIKVNKLCIIMEFDINSYLYIYCSNV